MGKEELNPVTYMSMQRKLQIFLLVATLQRELVEPALKQVSLGTAGNILHVLCRLSCSLCLQSKGH